MYACNGYLIDPYSNTRSHRDGDWIGDFFVLFWIAGIFAGAKISVHPYDVYCAVWCLGMLACLPAVGWLGARQDNRTTVCREMAYFLKNGMPFFKIFWWPFTILVAHLGDSQRRGFIDQYHADLHRERHGMHLSTAMEWANARASEIDQNCDAVGTVTSQALDAMGEIPIAACRTGVVAATLTGVASAQDPAAVADKQSMPVTTMVVARRGQNVQAPFTGTYHLLEVLQVRGKWIFPDVGYIDFATGSYHELCIGGGRVIYDGAHATLTLEGYFVQAVGPAAHGARYFWPNPIVDIKFTKKLTSQTGYIMYVPLNKQARVQQVIERAKLEYAVTGTWKFGGGYGAYQYGNGTWLSKPFATLTHSTPVGSFEVWLQKMPQGAQLQLRYTFAHTSK